MRIKYKNLDLGLLIVRLALSALFFGEVFAKLTSFVKTEAFFGSIGLNLPILYFVIAVELIAAIVMLLGIFSEWGYVIAIEMAFILARLQWPHGFLRGNLEMMTLAAALLIALAGPGKYSLRRRA